MNCRFVPSSSRTALILGCLLTVSLAGAETAQEPVQPAAADSTYQIDLATVLRLPRAHNLHVQLAGNAVDEAHAPHTSSVERFPPSPLPPPSYLRHTGT